MVEHVIEPATSCSVVRKTVTSRPRGWSHLSVVQSNICRWWFVCVCVRACVQCACEYACVCVCVRCVCECAYVCVACVCLVRACGCVFSHPVIISTAFLTSIFLWGSTLYCTECLCLFYLLYVSPQHRAANSCPFTMNRAVRLVFQD
jgi:hypothetical protein